MIKVKRLNSAILFFLSIACIFAQDENNLQRFISLSDSSINKIAFDCSLKGKNLKVSFKSASGFSVFENRILSLLKDKHDVTVKSDSCENILNFTVENCNVKYESSFREKLFGDYFSKRSLTFNCSYTYFLDSKLVKADSFSVSSADTVNVEKIKSFEIADIPFTVGEKPSEPIFDSILEPLIVIGSAVVSIILFFTIRGN